MCSTQEHAKSSMKPQGLGPRVRELQDLIGMPSAFVLLIIS